MKWIGLQVMHMQNPCDKLDNVTNGFHLGLMSKLVDSTTEGPGFRFVLPLFPFALVLHLQLFDSIFHLNSLIFVLD